MPHEVCWVLTAPAPSCWWKCPPGPGTAQPAARAWDVSTQGAWGTPLSPPRSSRGAGAEGYEVKKGTKTTSKPVRGLNPANTYLSRSAACASPTAPGHFCGINPFSERTKLLQNHPLRENLGKTDGHSLRPRRSAGRHSTGGRKLARSLCNEFSSSSYQRLARVPSSWRHLCGSDTARYLV